MAGLEVGERRAVAQRIDHGLRDLEVVVRQLLDADGGQREPRAELTDLAGEAIVGQVLARAGEHDRAQIDRIVAVAAERELVGERIGPAHASSNVRVARSSRLPARIVEVAPTSRPLSIARTMRSGPSTIVSSPVAARCESAPSVSPHGWSPTVPRWSSTSSIEQG